MRSKKGKKITRGGEKTDKEREEEKRRRGQERKQQRWRDYLSNQSSFAFSASLGGSYAF